MIILGEDQCFKNDREKVKKSFWLGVQIKLERMRASHCF